MSKIKITTLLILLGLCTLGSSSLLYAEASPSDNKPSTESVVILPNNQAKKEFLEDNDLMSRELQAVPTLKDTYVVALPPNQSRLRQRVLK